MTACKSTSLSRREFLVTAAAASLTVSCASHKASMQRASRSPIVDGHVHCFAGKNDPRFPYHDRAPYQPEALATPQTLLQRMDEAGIDFAVIVHPEPYQDDHRYLEYCLEVGQGRLKGTCLLFADRPGSVEKMPQLLNRMEIVAARVHAYAPDRLPPFGTPELRNLWAMAGENGLAVQIHFEPRYAPGFEPYINEFSDTTVVIDHLGRPFQGMPEEHEVVMKWARFPNTMIKLSSIPPNRSYPHREIAPIIRRITDEFGADRMIYGGGFGSEATGESYRAAVERARSYIDHLSENDQGKVLGGNAARVFGFG